MGLAVLGLALVVVTALAAAGLAACGSSSGDSSSGGAGQTASSGQGGSGAAADSFKAAYPKAQEAMTAVAEDAVLLAAGTTGLALADVPDSWGFSYFSPGQMKVYSVAVEHGKAAAPQEFGAAAKGTKVVSNLDASTIKVGAAEAVVKAREFGSQSGSVPKNVMVGGTFAETPSSGEAGYKLGVWTVTFATGTDLADAQAFTVDMMSGDVAKAKKQ